VLTIDSDTWAEFRMKAIAEDRPVGELVREWIKEYLEERED